MLWKSRIFPRRIRRKRQREPWRKRISRMKIWKRIRARLKRKKRIRFFRKQQIRMQMTGI